VTITASGFAAAPTTADVQLAAARAAAFPRLRYMGSKYRLGPQLAAVFARSAAQQRVPDAVTRARDPLRGIGHWLAPWVGRLGELPVQLHGRRGDYLADQASRIAERTAAAAQLATPGRPRRRVSTAAAREGARAQLAALLARRWGAGRTDGGPGRDASRPFDRGADAWRGRALGAP